MLHSYIITSFAASDLNSEMHMCFLISLVAPAPSVIFEVDWSWQHGQFIRSADGIVFLEGFSDSEAREQFLKVTKAFTNLIQDLMTLVSKCSCHIWKKSYIFRPSYFSLHGSTWVQNLVFINLPAFHNLLKILGFNTHKIGVDVMNCLCIICLWNSYYMHV